MQPRSASLPLEEVDVEGILAFADRVLTRATELWVQASRIQKQPLAVAACLTVWRSTESHSIEPPQAHRFPIC